MKFLSTPVAMAFLCLTTFVDSPVPTVSLTEPPGPAGQKIQAAILLDVSGSMSGLIEQAKAQLWNMVNVMGKAKCETGSPRIEIALYAYGQADGGSKGDHIRQITAFSSDLDLLSQELFKLTITGSEEYCGKVIHTSLDELSWDMDPMNYKVIFIAGNESFLQGDLHYTQACAGANKKGVIVNTIYCGDSLQGIREHWNLAGECGNGSYSYINHNAQLEDIVTPFDSVLMALNSTLNGTYLYYGYEGSEKFEAQARTDRDNFAFKSSVAAKRTEAKAKSNVYSNSSWDLVDASRTDSNFIKKVDKKTLPENLKGKTDAELKQIIRENSARRTQVQKEILEISNQRNAYINSERAKRASRTNESTLETAVEKIITRQAKRFKMVIEEN